MAIPTLNDVAAVSPVLTSMLVGYKQADSRFVADRVFPVITDDIKESGTYYILTKKYWFADEMQTRAPGSKFARGGFGVETATYLTKPWGLEFPIPDENRNASQLPLTLEAIGSQWLAQQSLIKRERTWAAANMAVSVWTTQDNNSATDWDDFEAGDPFSNLRTGKRAISQLTGQEPNTLVVGEVVMDALVAHPDLIDRIKYTQAATAVGVQAALASILGIGRILEAKGQYLASNEGAAVDMDPIIDDDALLCYVTPTPGIFEASVGYTLAWDGGGGAGMTAQYRDQSTKSDILQMSEQWAQELVAADLGAIWLDIV